MSIVAPQHTSAHYIIIHGEQFSWLRLSCYPFYGIRLECFVSSGIIGCQHVHNVLCQFRAVTTILITALQLVPS